MSRPEVHVACAADAGYLPNAATLISSLASSNPLADTTVHFLPDPSIDENDLRTLTAWSETLGVDLRVVRLSPEQIAGLPPSGRYPEVIWYRLLLPELLPEVERVLYVDADTLILQDLRPLFEVDLDGRPLGAARAPATRDGAPHLARLRFPAGSSYFNSGVLLMDLAEMRSTKLGAQILQVGFDREADIVYPDQDALNLACLDRWQALHPRWNSLAWFFIDPARRDAHDDVAYLEAIAAPGILHFEGTPLAKPWHARCVHPHRELYRSHRSRTPWPLTELEGAGPASALLRRMPVRLQLAVSAGRHAVLRRLRGPAST